MRRTHSLGRYTMLAAIIGLSFQVSAQQSEQYTGIITDNQGQPLKNARVHVHGRQQYVYADNNGQFSITAPVNSQLHISASGYGDQFITLSPAQRELQVSLKSGGIERIVVSASGIHKYQLEMASPVSVLTGEELSRRLEPTIGETLKYEPGVHANYYGPVASSPVIRGLDGPRVKMLSNGLDTADVSRVGPDHAITGDAITSEQIEVLRGPATLLYGSGAIGGVVNIVDNRIPRQLRSETETKVEGRFNDVANEKTLAFNHEGSNDVVAWHFDGYQRDASDYDVPRFENDEGEVSQTLENSWIDSKNISAGLSYIGTNGLLGFSIGRLESDYGIPGHHAHAEEHEDEEEHDEEHEDHAEEAGVYAKLKQNRISVAGEWYQPFSGFETLSLNAAYTDYQHQEIEDLAIGTTFNNKSVENRLTLEHETWQGWHGVFGYHLQYSDYSALGEEAFTPDSQTTSHALFILEEKQFGQVTAQLGGRMERVKHEAGELELGHELHIAAITNRFAAFSASAGLVWEFVPGFSWALAVSHSERAPSAAELYANGAHIATSSYEVGRLYQFHEGELELADNAPKKETANNIDLTFRRFEGDLTFTYNFFYNSIADYIYQANTGLTLADLEHDHEDEMHEEDHEEAHEDEHGHGDLDSLPVYHYQQHDATLYGLEFEMRYQFAPDQAVELFADKVRAKLDNGGNLPRIPPLKAGINYQYQAQSWNADIGVTYFAKQDKVATNESRTGSYTLVDASLNYDLNVDNADITLFVRGTNLTNELGFVHSSFIKEDAPLPGRALTLGIRATF